MNMDKDNFVINSSLSIDTDKLKNNNDFVIKFNSLYPDLNLNTLDNELITDIVLYMYNEKIIDLPQMDNINEETSCILNNLSDIKKEEIGELIEEYGIDKNYLKKNKIALNRIKADELIPELFVPGELIIINGKLLDNPVKIFLDSGASGCCIGKSTVKRCNLIELVDTESIVLIESSTKFDSRGKIWYVELFIQDNQNNLIPFATTFEVIDDISSQFDLILGSNFFRTYNANINYKNCIVTLDNSVGNQVFISFI